MSNDINRLRELAGIKSEPVKSKKKLDEGVIGSMQEVRHVSERNDPNWDDFFNNDREAGIEEPEADSPAYQETDPDDIFARGDRVDYNDEEMGDDHDSVSALDLDRFDREHFDGRDQQQALDDYKMKLRYHQLAGEMDESAPPGMEDWIKSNKQRFKDQYGDDWEEILYATAWKMKNNESAEEGAMESLANEMEEDMLVSKEQRIVDDAKSMIQRGMDPDSVVMSLADEYGLSTEEQFDLYNIVMNPVEEATDDDVKPDYIDLDNDGDTEEPMAQAADDKRYVQKKEVEEESKPDYIDLDNDGDTEESMKKAAKDKEEVEEDFANGYDKQIEVDADGYFPRGAHHSVDKDAGPSSAKHGDNPMQKKMDVTESKQIHRDLAANYRLFKKS